MSGLKRAGLGTLIGLVPGVLVIGIGLFIQEVLIGAETDWASSLGIPLTVVGAVFSFVLGAVDPHSPTGQTTIGVITGIMLVASSPLRSSF